MKYLIISDTHISPFKPQLKEWSNLARYIVKHKPDFIIHLGDVAELDSQARYVKDKGVFTLEEELNAVKEHLNILSTELKNLQDKQKAQKIKVYRPRLILCLGNHDVRKDTDYIKSIFELYGWEVYDEHFVNEDIAFAHYLTKGLSEFACVTPQELLENNHCSCVVGHSHIKGYAESYNPVTGKKIFAIKCPIFTNYKHPEYSQKHQDKYSRGFTILDTDKGEFQWKTMNF